MVSHLNTFYFFIILFIELSPQFYNFTSKLSFYDFQAFLIELSSRQGPLTAPGVELGPVDRIRDDHVAPVSRTLSAPRMKLLLFAHHLLALTPFVHNLLCIGLLLTTPSLHLLQQAILIYICH